MPENATYLKENTSNLLDFFRFCFIIRERLRKDWDLAVAITGERGVGKSVLSIQMGTIIQYGDISNELMKEFIEQRMLLAPSPAEVIKKHLEKQGEYGVMVLDEAIRIAYNRESMNKENIILNKIFTVNRKENMLHILCIPRFFSLDPFWRNDRIKYWIHVYSRGCAAVFAQGLNPFQKDSWNLKTNEFRFNKFAIGQKRKAYEIEDFEQDGLYKSLPNYLQSFMFPNINKELLDYYKALTEKQRYLFKIDELGDMPGWKY